MFVSKYLSSYDDDDPRPLAQHDGATGVAACPFYFE